MNRDGPGAPSTRTDQPSPSTHRSFRLVVFDLDGTLIDSRRDLADAVNALVVECGGHALAEERVGRMVGDGAATLVARAFEAAAIARPDDALPRFLAIYAQHLTDHTRAYDGIHDVLTAFRARTTLAILTNKPIASTRIILDRLDLARYFDPARVVGGDGPFPRKPDPSGLRALIRSAAVRVEDTLLIGDSIIDWNTARAAGARVCLARYGFGYSQFPEEKLAREDLLVDAPIDLLRL